MNRFIFSLRRICYNLWKRCSILLLQICSFLWKFKLVEACHIWEVCNVLRYVLMMIHKVVKHWAIFHGNLNLLKFFMFWFEKFVLFFILHCLLISYILIHLICQSVTGGNWACTGHGHGQDWARAQASWAQHGRARHSIGGLGMSGLGMGGLWPNVTGTH